MQNPTDNTTSREAGEPTLGFMVQSAQGFSKMDWWWWLSQSYFLTEPKWQKPGNRKICQKWAYFSRQILNNGYPFLPKWPLKMGKGFEVRAAHPCPTQIWVPPSYTSFEPSYSVCIAMIVILNPHQLVARRETFFPLQKSLFLIFSPK